MGVDLGFLRSITLLRIFDATMLMDAIKFQYYRKLDNDQQGSLNFLSK